MERGPKNKRMREQKDRDIRGDVQCYFPVKRPREYSGNFPSFRQPTEIGCFSLDGQRRFHPDNRQMKYLVMPPVTSGVKFDLNKGYNRAIRKNQSTSEKLDNILRWILANKSKVVAVFAKGNPPKDVGFSADFVCYRGLLTQLVCTVYENKEDWIICATKFRGTVYLCEFFTERRIEHERNQSERQSRMSAWGYKFEQYMVAEAEDGTPDLDSPVNENEEFCIAIRGKLGDSSLLFAAEVDCVNTPCPKESTFPRCYIELKTSRMITTETQDWNFCRYKLLKWWAQSFLIGIPKIICGFRDDSGIVQNVRTFRTTQIPKMGENLWSPSTGMNFCDSFLQFVKKVVVKDDSSVVYKFHWRPGEDVQYEELSPAGEFQILPEWYVNSFTDKQEASAS